MKWLLLLLVLTSVAHGHDVLFQQKEIVHLARATAAGESLNQILRVEPRQTSATPVRISGWVKSRGVVGVPGNGFCIVTNLEYAQTPVFWDTVIFPETGTQPWRYVEKLIHARLPIQAFEVKFRLDRRGEVWFRDFKVEVVEPWEENADLVVGLLGDSTDMISYLPEPQGVSYQLELLLRDRLPGHIVQVRNLAESGDWLGQLLSSGRLERELATLPRCDIMVVRYGLNDNSYANPDQFKAQLAETCDRVINKFPNAQIIVATSLPPRGEKFEKVTRLLAEERKLPLIDMAERFRTLAAQGIWNWHTGPGAAIGFDTYGDPAGAAKALAGNIHPNALGCRLIAEAVFHIVAPLAEAQLGPPSK